MAASYPTCVRHLKPRKDVRLRHYFLCDVCAEKWQNEAFDGNASLWDSNTVKGYCLLCNKQTDVCIRTWFLCDICHRVAGSIGRNHVAEQAILDWWKKDIASVAPHLRIEQNDISALRARRDTDVSGEGPLDFLVHDDTARMLVFGLENKTGRSSIREMSKFQLDVSDCDAILHHVQALHVPAYVIHAQVLEAWLPPTVGFHCVGLWWSDIFTMGEHFASVQMRRDEQRGAAYFRKQAFRDISTLKEALFDASGALQLVQRFKRQGPPRLYLTS